MLVFIFLLHFLFLFWASLSSVFPPCICRDMNIRVSLESSYSKILSHFIVGLPKYCDCGEINLMARKCFCSKTNNYKPFLIGFLGSSLLPLQSVLHAAAKLTFSPAALPASPLSQRPEWLSAYPSLPVLPKVICLVSRPSLSRASCFLDPFSMLMLMHSLGPSTPPQDVRSPQGACSGLQVHFRVLIPLPLNGLSRWLRQRICLQCGRPVLGRSLRRAWQPTQVFLPGESCGQRSLVGYSPWCPIEWTRPSD